MRPRSLVAAVLSAAALTSGMACGRKAPGFAREAPSASRPAPAQESLACVDAERRTQAAGAPATAGESQPASLQAMTAARKLVRTGQVTVEVRSCRDAMQALARLAQSLGGYVADSRSQRDDEGRERGTVTLRVPAGRFDELVSGAWTRRGPRLV